MSADTLVLALAFFIAAILYSSVGHAGASGYLAAMAYVGLPTPMMRPTALVLNLLVASITSLRFIRAGLFSWSLFWPFAAGSIPMAFVGGAITLPGQWYRILIGLVLWMAAARMWTNFQVSKVTMPPSRTTAVLCGGLLGLVAGLTGTGGGIFLSPLLLLMGWAETRTTGGVSAVFILVNSAAGLAGNPGSLAALPDQMWIWAGAAILGGLIGSELGTRRLSTATLRRLLGVVLFVAGAKLIFS